MGCRLNIRQISYNWKSFGSNAKIVMIDIDKSEIEKHTLNIDYKMHYSLESFSPILLTKVKDWKVLEDHINYLKWCQKASTYLLFQIIITKKFSNKSLCFF